MRLKALIVAAVGAALPVAAFGAAAETRDRQQVAQTSGPPPERRTVEQGGAKADALKAMLTQIRLPPGFQIDLYAIVPEARHMAVGQKIGVVFVGARKTNVWSITDRDQDRRGDEVARFAPNIAFKMPNGVCFARDGTLYVAEQNRLVSFPSAEFFYERPDPAVATVMAPLIPRSEESPYHSARVCALGPDDKIYLAQGQPYNVSPPVKLDLYDRLGLGAIVRMDRDGTNWEVYAKGIRNSVGLDFNPANGELWFTDNQVDGMGDDIPPGELNRATGPRQHFGFPWYGGGSVRTIDYQDAEPPAGLVFPEVETVAHATDLGMTFYDGDQFPAEYHGGIFSAQHGSWDRSTPIGARVMFTPLEADGSAGETRVFASGWLDESTGSYRGRPVDVVQYLDGSILVSDDYAGAVYRIWYED